MLVKQSLSKTDTPPHKLKQICESLQDQVGEIHKMYRAVIELQRLSNAKSSSPSKGPDTNQSNSNLEAGISFIHWVLV